jgi:hypothetical protein
MSPPSTIDSEEDHEDLINLTDNPTSSNNSGISSENYSLLCLLQSGTSGTPTVSQRTYHGDRDAENDMAITDSQELSTSLQNDGKNKRGKQRQTREY